MIDTLSIARRLSKTGVKREQAEAFANVFADVVVDAVSDAVAQKNGNLATKEFVHDQIKVVRGEIKTVQGEIKTVQGEISDLRVQISDLRGDMNTNLSDLRGEIHAQETRIVRWIVGTGIVAIGYLIAEGLLF